MTRSIWLNPANGDFDDPSNWSNGVPGSSDTAIFDVGSKPYTVIARGQTTEIVHIEAGHVVISGALNASSLNVDQGSVVGFEAPSSDTAPTFDFGSISSTGVLQAIDGLDFRTSNDTVIRNLSAGTLTGGAWEAIGASSVVDLTGGPIVVLAATVALSGYRADLETHEDSNSSIPLERSLTTIASGGRLMLGDDSFFSSYSPGLENESGGLIALSNGVHGADLDQMYGVTLDAGSRVTGNGSIGATVNAKAGSITAASGGTIAYQGFRDTFYGTFAGPGTVELSSGADTIEAGARVHSGGLFLSDSQVSLDENLT